MAGLGFVGRETVRLLAANQERFCRRLGARIELAAVCDRDVLKEARALGLGSGVLRATAPQQLLGRPLDIIVELMGGLEAPRRLVVDALKSGRHVVTANKRLLSHCWDEIQKASAAGGGRLYFEGSVAGGIPLLAALDNSFAANRIDALYGILNGTTNYILTRAEAGLSLEDALKEAQKLGFAEKDPTMDVSGQDTAQKISVLASLITGAWIKPGAIDCSGITGLSREDLDFARESLGRAVRLLGVLRFDWKDGVRVEAHVAPTLVPLEHPLAAVRREYNAVLVKTSAADDLMFYGKGAGPGPTASAVVGDIFMLSRDILGAIPARRAPLGRAALAPAQESVSSFYLRLFAQDRPGVLSSITAGLGRHGVSIATIHQSDVLAPLGMPIVLTTHPTTLGRFQKALEHIGALKTVARRKTVMRILPS